MSLLEKQNAIIDEFNFFEDWMQKYEYIIELGKELPKIKEENKTELNLIEGCQSRVWLKSNFENDRMLFFADSDAIITKGIISLLIQVLNKEKPVDIVKANLFFISEIGLQEHLSPTRANGLLSMVNRMKQDALKYINF
ncbi:MAG: SufE family protein [Crocinitomicaceae bacterium]|nr:SufE family protein [Crocinitomicaceae bacterium]